MNDKKSNLQTLISGKALDRYFDLQKALMDFSELFEYDKGDDRSIVIVGATFLDTILEHILFAFFPEDEKDVCSLFKYDKPLGTYGNKIKMAYCLGLIDKLVKDDLVLIGKIRNKFAHDLYASFEKDEIKQCCEQLKWHEVFMMEKPPIDATIRDIYQVGVNTLISHLHGIVSIAGSQKRIIQNNFETFLIKNKRD